MPTKTTKKKAATAKQQGKAPSTQASAFVGEKLHKLKRGQGNAKNKKQAIAIGLSEARQAGIKVGGSKKSAASKGSTAKASSSKSTAKKSAAKKPAAKASSAKKSSATKTAGKKK